MPPAPTQRLVFRSWRIEDLPLARALYGDERVTKLLGSRPYDEAMIQKRLADEIAMEAAHGFQYWPIFLANDEFVGCCGLRTRRPEQRIYELGFYLCHAHWGKGLAREAAASVLEYAFGPISASAIYTGHHPDNASSRKVLDQLGFRYTHHELYPPTGLEEPCYELTRDDWRHRV